jgi:hypothetical protein
MQTSIEDDPNLPVAIPLDVQSEPIVCVATTIYNRYDIENNIRNIQAAEAIDDYEYTRFTVRRIFVGIVLVAGIITSFVVGIKNW